MACVILIHAKNRQERNRILTSLDDDITCEVIPDLMIYMEKKYKGRFVKEEEDGDNGNSTQLATTEVALLEEMTRNSQMIATEGNASTNVNVDVRRENDNEQSVEPEVKNEPVVVAEGPHPNIADNNPIIDTNLSQSTNINNTDTPLNNELPLYAYLSTLPESNTDDNGVNVQCLENAVEPEEELMGIGDEGTEDGTAATGGHALANRNTTALEEDGYGTFIPYRDSMVEPKEETVVVGALALELGEQLANECDINQSEAVAQLEYIAQNEQVLADVADHTDIPLITHSSPDNGNIENDLHTDDGADVPYLDNVVSDVLLEDNTTNSETPVTVRSTTRSMKRGRNVVEDEDEEADSSKEDTKSSSVDDIPSTSTVRRSGRVAKKPKYSMDDKDEDKNGIECKKCLKKLNAQYKHYSMAKQHAVTHIDLMSFECPVDGCGHKSVHCNTMQRHLQVEHPNCGLAARKIDLTTEQKEELDQTIKECFPEFGTKEEYKVCTICQTAISNERWHFKEHSLQHIDFMLYKCNQKKCRYETKYLRYMTIHLRNKHGIEGMSKKSTEIQLTNDQKKEIDDTLKKCFPDENEDVDE